MRILIVLLLMFMVGCKKQPPHKEPSFPVKIAAATTTDVPVILNSYGTLSSPNTVDIRAQVTGEILAVPLKEGAYVQKGDLLIAIDPSSYLATLQNTKASVLGSKANAYYTKESYESYKQLRDQDFISVIDLANYYKNWQVAEATVLADMANVDNAKINVGYTQITAPIDGIIGFMGNQVGNIANTTDTLVTLVQIKPLYVVCSLSEQDLWLLRQAGPVSVEGTFLSKERPPIKGFLHAIDNSVNTQTGTILIKAEFPNESLEGWPGEFVRIGVLLKTLPGVIVINKNAIQYGQKGPYVYVVDQTTMQVSIRNVTLGPSYNEDQVAIMNGLKNKEVVVIDGQLNLYSGAKVFLAS